MLTIHNVNQFYGQSHILWDTELTVKPGCCTCLMGRNGMGKTTLLKAIMGLLPIQSGSIRLQSHELTALPAYKRAAMGIGYVPQGREIFAQLSVEENLLTALSTRRPLIKTVPERIYELFPVLKSMLKRRGGDLSGGQQQQLAIGRALALEPSLLILDEPAEGIQPNIVQEIGQVIQRLNQEQNLTVLLVEQKLPFARRYADYFYLMEKGSTVANGSIDQLNDELVQQYLAV